MSQSPRVRQVLVAQRLKQNFDRQHIGRMTRIIHFISHSQCRLAVSGRFSYLPRLRGSGKIATACSCTHGARVEGPLTWGGSVAVDTEISLAARIGRPP